MRRETYIEENKNEFIKTNENVVELVENFKKNHLPKINLKLEPILNAILTSNKLKSEDVEKLYEDVLNNYNLYYYMASDLFLKLFHYVEGITISKNLNKLKKNVLAGEIPPQLIIKEEINKEMKELYNIRYNNLLLRYIDYLINLYI